MRRTDIRTLKRAVELRRNLSDGEKRLWQAIRRGQINGVHFRRQHAIGPYIVDFCAPRRKIVIEVDGAHHQAQKEYDSERTTFLEQHGYRVLRFWNHDILGNIDGVMQMIIGALRD